MIPIPLSTQSSLSAIRRVDLARDLSAIASLIETCFPIHLDHDGQTYVAEMRKSAREMRLWQWLPNAMMMEGGRAPGFVWEENGCIIGNLSLIPLQESGRRVHLIANVAVAPQHRQRGIGRALTEHALSYLREKKEKRVWLQVRDDNPPALNLYRSLGLVEQSARSTWRVRPVDLDRSSGKSSGGVTIRRRKPEDWLQQKAWLDEAYPDVIRWNLPLDIQNLDPGLFQRTVNLIEGRSFKHWAVAEGEQLQGVITWQKTTSHAHNLWLAFPEDIEKDYLSDALADVCRRLARHHPLSVDYPKGRFTEGFRALGFEHFRTLVWMLCKLGKVSRD